MEARSAETMRPGMNLSSQFKKYLKKIFKKIFNIFFYIKFFFSKFFRALILAEKRFFHHENGKKRTFCRILAFHRKVNSCQIV